MGPGAVKRPGLVPRRSIIMAAAKKTVDIDKEIEDQVISSEVAEVVEARDEAHGVTEESSDTRAESSSEEVVKATKSGKRSTKGQAESEAKLEKIEHQLNRDEEKIASEDKPKQPVKPTRTRLERRGKKYRKQSELIEKGKVYNLKDALDLATKTTTTSFDASVEMHVNLGVDPRQADQNIRASLVLPQGTGKVVRVAVFSDDNASGADVSGVEIIMGELEKGVINFDVLISTPTNMAKLGKYARMLGPRGLMPNPKSGTVTQDVAKAVSEAKAGRVEYRVDSTGIIHLAVGKVSFGPDKLLENASAVLNSIKSAKPASIKGTYVKAIHLTTTMGPSIVVSANE